MHFKIAILSVVLLSLALASAFPAQTLRNTVDDLIQENDKQNERDILGLPVRLVRLVVDSKTLTASEEVEWQNFINKWGAPKEEVFTTLAISNEYMDDLGRLPIKDVKQRLSEDTKREFNDVMHKLGERVIERQNQLKARVAEVISNAKKNGFEDTELEELLIKYAETSNSKVSDYAVNFKF